MKEIKIKYEPHGNRIIVGCLEEQFYGSRETKDEAIKDMEAQIQFFKELCWSVKWNIQVG